MKQGKSVISRLPFEQREEVFDLWYKDACYCGGMVEYHLVDGCYVLLDTPMQIWDFIKDFVDGEMKRMKVKKCYFPLIKADDPSEEGLVGKSMYPYYSKWIRSPSDLPLKCNQWCTGTSSELRKPTPFLRSREFLWQEGHSAFATKKEAYADVSTVMDVYSRIFEDFLAVPFLIGRKSKDKKLKNALLFSTALQVFIPETGEAVEGATLHCLGQELAKTFHIRYEKEIGVESAVWQNSWSFSSAAIGLMIMIHGDDKGLVLPPKVAPVQVIVIPVPTPGFDIQHIRDACGSAGMLLELAGIRTEVDRLGDIPLAFKQAHWEQRGVPLRILIGGSELENNTVLIVRRDSGETVSASRTNLADPVVLFLKAVQKNLALVAKRNMADSLETVETWEQFVHALNSRKLVFAPWSDEPEVEEGIKDRTNGLARLVCTPFDQPSLPLGTLCFASGSLAKTWSYWSQSL